MAKKSETESPHKQHRQRMKTQFLANGLTGLSEHRALELLLFYSIPQGDVVDTAKALIHTFGSLSNVLKAPYEALLKVKGVGDHTATLLKLMPSLWSYVDMSETEVRTIVKTKEKAADIFKPYFRNATVEKVFVMFLDGNYELLGVRLVGEGSLLSAGIDRRLLLSEAMMLNAVFVYIAHNHVTGPIDPSGSDWTTTVQMIELLHPFDIYLVDHLIIGKGNFASIRELNKQKQKPLPWPI